MNMKNTYFDIITTVSIKLQIKYISLKISYRTNLFFIDGIQYINKHNKSYLVSDKYIISLLNLLQFENLKFSFKLNKKLLSCIIKCTTCFSQVTNA